jgi:hypothetical protein
VTTSAGSSGVDALLDSKTAMPSSKSVLRVDQPEVRCIVSIAPMGECRRPDRDLA